MNNHPDKFDLINIAIAVVTLVIAIVTLLVVL